MENTEKYLMDKIIFDETLVSPCIQANNAQTAITATAQVLLRHNYVHSTYPQAVWTREQSYPTGLMLENICIAIPHTDIEHVQQSAIAISVLHNPVVFHAMGDPDTELQVRALFMLAIHDPSMQIDVLQRLSEVFQRPNAVEMIISAQTPTKIAAAFRREMEG